MEKVFSKITGVELNSHTKIEFANVLNKDFLMACDMIRVDYINSGCESLTYKDNQEDLCNQFKIFLEGLKSEQNSNEKNIKLKNRAT